MKKLFRIVFIFFFTFFTTLRVYGHGDTISESICVRIIVIDSVHVSVNKGVGPYNEEVLILLLCDIDSLSREILGCKYGKGRIILRVTDRNIVLRLKENEKYSFRVILFKENQENHRSFGLHRSPCLGHHLRLDDEKWFLIYEVIE